jgi:hypothetical protein
VNEFDSPDIKEIDSLDVGGLIYGGNAFATFVLQRIK